MPQSWYQKWNDWLPQQQYDLLKTLLTLALSAYNCDKLLMIVTSWWQDASFTKVLKIL